MNSALQVYGSFVSVVGRIFFALAVVTAVVALVDWLVRTRRINPFNPVARFFRRSVSPLMAPVERRIVRAGGMPTSAPWWTLVVVVVGGLIAIWVLRFIGDQAFAVSMAARQGPRGVARMLVGLGFSVLQIALIVRVISSWFQASPYSPWIRWSYTLTEWFLRPLRQIVPTLGPVDITPIIAYILLRILESVVLRFI